jgi:hypothetical protein
MPPCDALAVTRTPLPPVCSRCVPPRGQAVAKPRPRSRCPYLCGLLSYAERKACVWVCALRGSTYILLKPSHSVRGVCWVSQFWGTVSLDLFGERGLVVCKCNVFVWLLCYINQSLVYTYRPRGLHRVGVGLQRMYSICSPLQYNNV